jgi:hypothetical protein
VVAAPGSVLPQEAQKRLPGVDCVPQDEQKGIEDPRIEWTRCGAPQANHRKPAIDA